MLILVLEGIDKTGKSTQSAKLAQTLTDQGYRVEVSEFHRYDTPTGKLIRQFLDGEYEVPQVAIECVMAADKYAQAQWFEGLEKNTDILILDRYILSQLVYSKSLGLDVDFMTNLLQYLKEPDFHIYLDISPESSIERRRGEEENDKYERDHSLMTTARNNYLTIIEKEVENNKAIIVDATLPIDEVHNQILEGIEFILPPLKEVSA